MTGGLEHALEERFLDELSKRLKPIIKYAVHEVFGVELDIFVIKTQLVDRLYYVTFFVGIDDLDYRQRRIYVDRLHPDGVHRDLVEIYTVTTKLRFPAPTAARISTMTSDNYLDYASAEVCQSAMHALIEANRTRE